ncbi:hypothetical protein D9M69_479410 [compost metagenome]
MLRIRDPRLRYGRYDAVARFLFATWQIYAVTQGASLIILGFTAMELLFGVLESLPVRSATAGVPMRSNSATNLSASPQP